MKGIRKPWRSARAAAIMTGVLFAAALAAYTQVTAPPSKQMKPKVLVKGSPLHGANGLMFDNQDRLYVASVGGNEIVVMDPKNGKILDRIGLDRGVYSPDDLAFGPDGSLYWASILEGQVGRLAPDGSVTTQPVAAGTNPITVSRDGRIFVGLCFLGDGLFEIDPALQHPPKALTKTAGMLNGFDFGPDGLLYAPVYFEGKVVRMNVNATTVAYETVGTGFEVPSALKFDSRGYLHGLSQLSGEVWSLDPASGRKTVLAHLPPGIDNLAFDSRGRLYVSHANDGSIFEVLLGAPRRVSGGGMIAPGGVAVMPRVQGGESVFVADIWTVREFNGLTGRAGSTQDSSFAVPEGIAPPSTVSADGGNLVISSWFGNTVQVWNPETRQVVENHPAPNVPLNAIRYGNDLVVAELVTHSVVRLTASGREVLTDKLYVPTGLAASQGDLWAADWATGTVWKIMAGGSPVMVPVAQGLAGLEGLAVDQDGSLLVVEAKAGRLSRIDVVTGAVSVLAEGLELGSPGPPSMPPTWVFNGVAVGPSGAIYVTGDKSNVLYRLRFPG